MHRRAGHCIRGPARLPSFDFATKGWQSSAAILSTSQEPNMTSLIAGGLCLRPLRHSDADAFAAAALESQATVGQWLPWCHAGYSLEEARQWLQACERNLEAGTAYSMGIFPEDGELLLGGIGINQINREHNFAQVGYWIRQSQQGRGIAPRALGMIAGFGFNVLGLTRLEIMVQDGNHGSRRVAEKAGATFDGLLKNRLMVRGTPCADAMYSLTPGDMIPTAA
jgi:RimJ/RimL family protein N-acetyltransferase